MTEANQATTAKRQRPLKVWGGLTLKGGKQHRTIVAATSQANAAEALGCTLHELRGYWAVTGNKTELGVALAKPGQVFIQSTPNGGVYLPKVRVGGAWVDA